MTEQQPDFKIGDEVRTKEGTVGVIEDLNPDNPPDEYWALLMVNGLTNVDVQSPEGVVIVRTAAELSSRKIPTVKEMTEYTSSALHSGFGGEINVSETDIEGEGRIEVYGRTGDGLPFCAHVQVLDVDWADE